MSKTYQWYYDGVSKGTSKTQTVGAGETDPNLWECRVDVGYGSDAIAALAGVAPAAGAVSRVSNHGFGQFTLVSSTDASVFVLECKASFPWSKWTGNLVMFTCDPSRGIITINSDGAVRVRVTTTGGTSLIDRVSTSYGGGTVPDGVQGVFKVRIDMANGTFDVTWNGSSIFSQTFSAGQGNYDMSRTANYMLRNAAGDSQLVEKLEYLKISPDDESTFYVDISSQAASDWNTPTNNGTRTVTRQGVFSTVEYVGWTKAEGFSGANGPVLSYTALDDIGSASGTGDGGELQEGDVVFVLSATTSNTARTNNITGYTFLPGDDVLFGADLSARAMYKVMGPTPDTGANLLFNGDSTASHIAIAVAVRGLDTASILDVTAVEAEGGAAGTVVNPAAITPATLGAPILVFGAASDTTSFDIGVNADLTFVGKASDTGTGARFTIGAIGILRAWETGAFDPGVWTSTNTPSGDEGWWAGTVAVSPG